MNVCIIIMIFIINNPDFDNKFIFIQFFGLMFQTIFSVLK